MYDIYLIGKNMQLNTPNDKLYGSSYVVLRHCIKVLNFDPFQLEQAVHAMCNENSDHDAAHFGVNKTFIYSYKRPTKDAA
jgi:hypothetical protein